MVILVAQRKFFETGRPLLNMLLPSVSVVRQVWCYVHLFRHDTTESNR